MNLNDTIAAISTAYGRGGIAVLRISGDNAVNIASKVFLPVSGKSLCDAPHSKAVYGRIVGKDGQIDDGLATVFYAPKSFTGEDTVEISCHGGILLSQTILGELFRNGATPAGPGEFTQRAFINGKLSLTQAEAVIDLIDAKSNESIRLANAQSNGVLSNKITKLSSSITDLLSEAYVTCDYPDEDLNDVGFDEFTDKTKTICDELFSLASTYKAGSAIREGIPTAIVGRPNTGKSSLLNALLGKDRAIVTDIPGTTRDTLEETAVAGKVTLLLCDTAGIRKTDDVVENIGVERAKKAADEAKLILAVFDGSSPLNDEDKDLISFIEKYDCPIIPVVNKSDKDGFNIPSFPDKFLPPIVISASSGEGVENLKNTVSSLFVDDKINYLETAVISNARQYSAVLSAYDRVKSAYDGLKNGIGTDMAALDLEEAHSLLCETDGRGTADEITDKIFHRFCVGK